MTVYEAMVAVDEAEDYETTRQALQILIDTGLAWTLQGRVGRAAMDCINAGACAFGPERTHDYWGNTVPSRLDVVPGTPGSIEYVRTNGYEVAS